MGLFDKFKKVFSNSKGKEDLKEYDEGLKKTRHEFVSKLSNLSLSLPTNLLIGIDVHLEIIAAISSSSTVSDKISDLFFFCSSTNSFSNFGIVPCLNLAADSKS